MAGVGNTLIGHKTSANAPNLQNATAIGANAHITVSDAIVLGFNANVGIGTSAPVACLHVVGERADESGVRFGRLTATSPSIANTSNFLTVND